MRNAVRRLRSAAVPLTEPSEVADDTRQPADADETLLVIASLDRLAPADAEVLRLKHFEDLTLEAIARRTGSALNTVKSRYYRALDRLRRSVAAQRGERGPR